MSNDYERGYRDGWRDRAKSMTDKLNRTYDTDKRKQAAHKAWRTRRKTYQQKTNS